MNFRRNGSFWTEAAARFLLSIALCIGCGAVCADMFAVTGTETSELPIPTGPIGLDKVVEIALQRNPDLMAARERIAQAEARVEEAVAAFYPNLKADIAYSYSNNPSLAFAAIVAQRRFSSSLNINHPGFQANFRPELVATWSLFRGWRDSYQRKAAELGVDAAELEKAALRNQLAAAVTAAYYARLTAGEQIRVGETSRQTVQSELKHVRIRWEEGTVLRSDVLSLEARLAQTEEALLKSRNAVELTLSSLKTLLGLEHNEVLKIKSPTKIETPKVDDQFEALLAKALSHRPEMEAARRQVEIRQEELQAVRGAQLPRVDAYATYGQNTRSPNFSLHQDNFTVGVNAEVDLFTGGGLSARISAAEHKMAESRLLERRTRQEISDQVKQAYLLLLEAIERVRVTDIATTAAKEALRLVREQHRSGTATVTRYLEAQTVATDARSRFVSARYDALVAEANLNRATGYWR